MQKVEQRWLIVKMLLGLCHCDDIQWDKQSYMANGKEVVPMDVAIVIFLGVGISIMKIRLSWSWDRHNGNPYIDKTTCS